MLYIRFPGVCLVRQLFLPLEMTQLYFVTFEDEILACQLTCVIILYKLTE